MERERLLLEMKRRGVSRADLARLSEVPKSSVYGFLNGTSDLTVRNLERLKAVLRLDVAPPATEPPPLDEGEVHPVPPEGARDVMDELGILLVNTARMLRRKEYSKQWRLAHARAQLQSLALLVPELERMLQQEAESGD